LIADVISSGAVMYAPRTLQLLVDADAVCVRTPDGRLLWLETSDSSTFARADGRVHEFSHDSDDVVLLPRDTAADARALVGLSDALAWSAATVHPGSRPADTKDYEHRTADIRTATTEDGRPLDIVIDRATGVVLAITGSSLRGNFELKLRSVRVVDGAVNHFIARPL